MMLYTRNRVFYIINRPMCKNLEEQFWLTYFSTKRWHFVPDQQPYVQIYRANTAHPPVTTVHVVLMVCKWDHWYAWSRAAYSLDWSRMTCWSAVTASVLSSSDLSSSVLVPDNNITKSVTVHVARCSDLHKKRQQQQQQFRSVFHCIRQYSNSATH